MARWKDPVPLGNPGNPLYIRYHDEEWGVPVHDDRKLFEMLILENFQAGLSWECILNKREAFRRAFDGFDLEMVCAYGEEKLAALEQDPGIVRNRLKIRAAVNNAGVFKSIRREWGSFDRYLWHWTQGNVVCETGKGFLRPVGHRFQGSEKAGDEVCGNGHRLRIPAGGGVIHSHEETCFCKAPECDRPM